MTLADFSNGFDTLVSSYRRFKDFDNREILDSLEFDEYEKSLYLTEAQNDIVTSLYSGKNQFGDSFESTEEMRESLASLVRTAVFMKNDAVDGNIINGKSKLFKLPSDLMFIIFEQIKLPENQRQCPEGYITVYPVTHDEYGVIVKNPFRGANERRALRIDAGVSDDKRRVVEIVSSKDYVRYEVRYLKKPQPIILENLPDNLSIDGINIANECELSPVLHNKILERAVIMALRSKGINLNTDK